MQDNQLSTPDELLDTIEKHEEEFPSLSDISLGAKSKTELTGKLTIMISSAVLEKQVAACIRAVAKNPIVPILDCLHFRIGEGDLMTITGSDLRTSITATLPVWVVNNSLAENLGWCIEATPLHRLLLALPEQPVTLLLDGLKFSLLTESGIYNFTAENGADYPKQPTLDDPETFAWPADELNGIFRDLLPYMSQDDLRPAMTGAGCEVFSGGVDWAATDGHQLIHVRDTLNVRYERVSSFVVSGPTLKQFLALKVKGEEVAVELTPARIRFSWGNKTFTARLIEERFPDFRKAIPEEFTRTATVNRLALLRVLERAMLFVNAHSNQVALKFTPDSSVSVQATDLDTMSSSEETLDLTHYEGDGLTIGFNVKILRANLKAITSKHVQMRFVRTSRGVVVLPFAEGAAQENVTRLVMPVMLNQYEF